jgi:hypothetical protein
MTRRKPSKKKGAAQSQKNLSELFANQPIDRIPTAAAINLIHLLADRIPHNDGAERGLQLLAKIDRDFVRCRRNVTADWRHCARELSVCQRSGGSRKKQSKGRHEFDDGSLNYH